MRNIGIIFLLLAIYCSCGFCIEEKKKAEKEKMFAVYGADALLKKKENSPPEEVVKFLKDHGINAVFGGYENEKFRELCRNSGIKMYAELGCFQGEKFWKDYPESRPVTDKGALLEKEEWYYGVCPNSPEVRAKIRERAAELAEKYKVDGIWLDFIRYSCHWEVKKPKFYQTCFCEKCVNLFKSYAGDIKFPEGLEKDKAKTAEYILINHAEKWTQFKCDQIAGFARELKETIKKRNPKCMIGLFGVPWMREDFDNSIEKIVGQDLKKLSLSGVEIFSPMLYHKMCGKDVAWINAITEKMKETTGREIVPIIQACNEPGEMPAVEFENAITSGLKSPSSGIILFAASHIEKEKRWESVKKIKERK